ncbi:MAG: glycosyltransferase [Pseudomonadota bacterium]
MHQSNPSAVTPGQILLATCNGANHLQAQLDSLVAQSVTGWTLRTSDDGSTDDTRGVLAAFSDQNPDRAEVMQGPQDGFVANFLSLIRAADASAPWVALCDQDDVWLPHKLDRALAWLAGQDPATPALYCCRLWICGPDLDRRHLSPQPRHPPCFANALVQNIASGNTVVLNRAAVALAARCADSAGAVFAHDWWLYLLVTGAGGVVHFDAEPGVLYRQHDENAVGYGRFLSLAPRIATGRYADRIGRNIAALNAVSDVLTPTARSTLSTFDAARRARSVGSRLTGLRASGVHRQTPLGQLALHFAMAVRRV